jgi:hypothetical protein
MFGDSLFFIARHRVLCEDCLPGGAKSSALAVGLVSNYSADTDPPTIVADPSGICPTMP